MEKMSKFNLVLPLAFLLVISFACKKQDLTEASTESSLNLNGKTATTTTSTVAPLHIEGENYSAMSGVQTEGCLDAGATRDVSFIDAGDWMDYSVNVATTGAQTISFRIAGYGGRLQLKTANGTVVADVTLPSTNNWQTYTTVNTTANLTAGQQTLRIYAVVGKWNLNWFEIGSGGTTTTNTTTTSTTNNLLLQSNFDASTGLNGWGLETCRSNAITISTEVTPRKGSGMARFEFSKNDPIQYSGYVRAEMKQNSQTDNERWFGMSNYLPSDYASDPEPESIAQWHDVPDFNLGETWRSSPIHLGIKNDRYYITVMWCADAVNTNQTAQSKTFDLGPVDKGRWDDWAFHIKWSYNSDGILEVYKNKQSVLSYMGPNWFNDQNYPFFKLGIYKWTWNYATARTNSPEDKRVLYWDEVKEGNKYSNLTEVSPN